jgi:GT2 family glycosyltransferase
MISVLGEDAMDGGAVSESVSADGPPAPKGAAWVEPGFDEEMYLRLNPDVRLAVAGGIFRSGQEHYERFGRREGRPLRAPEASLRNRIVLQGDPDVPRELAKAPEGAVDTVRLSTSGGIYLVGWVNDAIDRLDSIDLYFSAWSVSLDAAGLARLRRPDAEAALASSSRHAFGFWGFLFAARKLPGGVCNVVLRLKSGAEASFMLNAEVSDDHEVRKMMLGNLASAAYFGNPYFEAVASIEHSIGAQLVDFNMMQSRRAAASPYVARFGRAGRRVKASIVVCLYGRSEFMFLQSAMFAQLAGFDDYEFIYVSNSPWIAEQLLKEARLCALVYGVDLTVVILNANAGFGAANNAAVAFANSDRLIIMNPDVFPQQPDWANRHSALVAELPAERSALFGAPLYYDDGSLMHAGMFFEIDVLPSFNRGRRSEVSLLRVEHYGKGAPPGTARFLRPRPVPAVTGAFMSIDRSWFERLGGFEPDYIFGHYEDADFCLKSIAAGRTPWLHDLRLWHLEGKGSQRRPQHEGGSVVNRWLFTRNWEEVVRRDLLGPEPERLAHEAGAI